MSSNWWLALIPRIPSVWAIPKREVIPTIDDAGRPVEVTVKPGQVYEFLCDVSTRAGHTHEKGSLLIVQDSTTKTPHGEISQSGVNWVCETRYGTSVWATLEQCIARGLFRLKD